MHMGVNFSSVLPVRSSMLHTNSGLYITGAETVKSGK